MEDLEPLIRIASCNPPIPTNICFEAWVDGYEERFGTAYGKSRAEAHEAIWEAIQMVREMEEDGQRGKPTAPSSSERSTPEP